MSNYVFYTTQQQGWKPVPYNALDVQGREAFIRDHVNHDAYYTPNTFKEPTSNTKDNLAELNAIVIDVDNHWEGITLDQAQHYVELLKPHFNAEIPTPSKIVYTGRGLHFYIALDPTKDIAKHELVSRGILEAYDKLLAIYSPLAHIKLSADKKALGAYRFVRLEGTYNSKANTTASRVYDSSQRYNLDMLIDRFASDLSPIKQSPSKTKSNAQDVLIQTTWTPYKGHRKEWTAKTWLYSAIDDLKTIQRNRDKQVRLTDKGYKLGNEGHRNTMLFIFGLMCKWGFNDSQEVLDSMRAFNEHYSRNTLTEHEVMTTYQSVIGKDYKPYRALKVIELLDITADEMTGLKVLIDRNEVKRRTRNRVKLNKQNKALKKRLKKQGIIAQAQELRATGLTQIAIAKELKISDRTVRKYLKLQ